MTENKTEKQILSGPSPEDLLEMQIEDRVQEKLVLEKELMLKKATAWAETKAITIAEKQKEVSTEMKVFYEQQIQLNWMFEQKALPEGDTAGQVMMKKMIGKELGLNTYQSITGLAFIKGKLAIWGKVFIGLITQAGYKIDFIKWTNEECECTISAPDGQKMTDIYTIEDAKKAGLYPGNGYGPWSKHTKKMLAYRAINNIASFMCPHVIGGAIIADDAKEELKNEKDPNKEKPNIEEITNKILNKFD